jgi:hypothetical protein
MKDDEIPAFEAYGYSIAEIDTSKLAPGERARVEHMRRMREIVHRFDAREAEAASRR